MSWDVIAHPLSGGLMPGAGQGDMTAGGETLRLMMCLFCLQGVVEIAGVPCWI
jgi:hypothetical protein